MTRNWRLYDAIVEFGRALESIGVRPVIQVHLHPDDFPKVFYATGVNLLSMDTALPEAGTFFGVDGVGFTVSDET